jgi:nitrogen fixation protein FixH
MKFTYAQKFIAGMIGLLALTIAVDVSAMVLGARSDDGLVVNHYYEEELRYEQTKDQVANPQGWNVVASLPREAGSQARVLVTLTDRARLPVVGAQANLVFYRPTKAGYDRVVALREVSPGSYQSDVTLPLAGIWDANLHLKKGSARLDVHERIRLPDRHS